MKYLKCLVLIATFLSINNSHSIEPNTSGWECYHNGILYTIVIGLHNACPTTGFVNNNNQVLAKHDPNDHNCVITRVKVLNL